MQFCAAIKSPGRTLFAPTMHFFDSLGSPSRGAPPLGGEGWPGGQKSTTNHPSVTFGDSSPRRGATLCTRYFGCHRGEHCSPAESYAAAKLPGRTLFAPTTHLKSAIKNRNFASSHRRVLAPGRGQCVRSWILKGNCAERRSDREAGRAVSLKPCPAPRK